MTQDVITVHVWNFVSKYEPLGKPDERIRFTVDWSVEDTIQNAKAYAEDLVKPFDGPHVYALSLPRHMTRVYRNEVCLHEFVAGEAALDEIEGRAVY